MKTSIRNLVVTVVAIVGCPGRCWAGEGGYVVGNFGIAAQITESDSLRAHIKVNPPELGQWLQDFGQGELWIEEGSSSHRARLRPVHVSRLYPEYLATFDVEGGLSAQIRIFAPLGLDSRTGFLPALILEATLKADKSWQGKLGYTLAAKNPASAPADKVGSDALVGLVRGPAFLGLVGSSSGDTSSSETATDLTLSAPVQLAPGSERKLILILGSFHPNGHYANEFDSAPKLLAALAQKITPLNTQLQEFTASLPVTGDRAIDMYLRWYVSAAILLTKGFRSGEVLTMGYRELNQRDSFWSSGIHLVFWRDLERKMLLETLAHQLPSGRIPVTILPVIDRGDEIDSAEYFILRVARYYNWYRDKMLLHQAWPAIKKAIDYLVSRDTENVGVPMQQSYWADWKDVPDVTGRKYAPHFVLLWIASLKAVSELAVPAGDPAAAARFKQLQVRAEAFLNRPFEQGGMWNDTHYVDLWKDGRKPDYVLQDQVVGAYFNVIPQDRLASIYARLSANETPWGVRETFPYFTGATTPYCAPGSMHNGGVWPYLNFVDVTGRYAHGYTVDAERLIRHIGHGDLEAEGDYHPGEYLHGDTGINAGFKIQAWDAALFSAIYFGAFGIDRVSETEIQIKVRTPRERDFSTHLTLPGTAGTLTSRAGKLAWQPEMWTRIKVSVIDERP